VTFREAYNC